MAELVLARMIHWRALGGVGYSFGFVSRRREVSLVWTITGLSFCSGIFLHSIQAVLYLMSPVWGVCSLYFDDLMRHIADSVADGTIALQSPRIHSRQHRDIGIYIVVNPDNTFRVVEPMKASDVLLQGAFP
jgi:hypothetical protein